MGVKVNFMSWLEWAPTSGYAFLCVSMGVSKDICMRTGGLSAGGPLPTWWGPRHGGLASEWGHWSSVFIVPGSWAFRLGLVSKPWLFGCQVFEPHHWLSCISSWQTVGGRNSPPLLSHEPTTCNKSLSLDQLAYLLYLLSVNRYLHLLSTHLSVLLLLLWRTLTKTMWKGEMAYP